MKSTKAGCGQSTTSIHNLLVHPVQSICRINRGGNPDCAFALVVIGATATAMASNNRRRARPRNGIASIHEINDLLLSVGNVVPLMLTVGRKE